MREAGFRSIKFAQDKTVYIRFFSAVNGSSVNALIAAIDAKMKEGISKFIILISSGGGTVFHGLSAYNYLVGIPAEITTHNFGTVDSIAGVLYCAGSKRYSVPHARFILHGAASNFPQGASLEEKQLEERLKGLRIDTENIAKVLATATKKKPEEIIQAMLLCTTVNAVLALAFVLVLDLM
ncbi:MAG: ATP-dependent Clp protease proteolytic subunit, partial [Nitrososphaera sp.]